MNLIHRIKWSFLSSPSFLLAILFAFFFWGCSSGRVYSVHKSALIGIPVKVWQQWDIEDRRVNTDPGDIGIGKIDLIKDDKNHGTCNL